MSDNEKKPTADKHEMNLHDESFQREDFKKEDSRNEDSHEEDLNTREKPMKEELTELLKPIAIHEAKSAIYKAKLAGYVLKKGAQGAGKAAKFMQEKTSDYLDDRRKKKKLGPKRRK